MGKLYCYNAQKSITKVFTKQNYAVVTHNCTVIINTLQSDVQHRQCTTINLGRSTKYTENVQRQVIAGLIEPILALFAIESM